MHATRYGAHARKLNKPSRLARIQCTVMYVRMLACTSAVAERFRSIVGTTECVGSVVSMALSCPCPWLPVMGSDMYP